MIAEKVGKWENGTMMRMAGVMMHEQYDYSRE